MSPLASAKTVVSVDSVTLLNDFLAIVLFCLLFVLRMLYTRIKDLGSS
jgi:hypothetical protein